MLSVVFGGKDVSSEQRGNHVSSAMLSTLKVAMMFQVDLISIKCANDEGCYRYKNLMVTISKLGARGIRSWAEALQEVGSHSRLIAIFKVNLKSV